jgi:hypothetical protein
MMLTPLLHRKRKAAEKAHATAKGAVAGVGEALQQTRQVYGVRLLVRGLLWVSLYALSRGILELDIQPSAVRVLVALLPTPFFVWYLWTWTEGVSRMDELQRRIELEALGFAFPAAVVFFATLGLLDVAVALNPDDFSPRHTWLIMPMLYYVGLWRAKRRYE